MLFGGVGARLDVTWRTLDIRLYVPPLRSRLRALGALWHSRPAKGVAGLGTP